jgi:hypothetical protein
MSYVACGRQAALVTKHVVVFIAAYSFTLNFIFDANFFILDIFKDKSLTSTHDSQEINVTEG